VFGKNKAEKRFFGREGNGSAKTVSSPQAGAQSHNAAAPWVILQLLFLDEQKGIGAVVQPHPSARTMPLLRAGTTGPAADRAGA